MTNSTIHNKYLEAILGDDEFERYCKLLKDYRNCFDDNFEIEISSEIFDGENFHELINENHARFNIDIKNKHRREKEKTLQRFWELFLFDHFNKAGIEFDCTIQQSKKPDFCITTNSGRVWIDATMPTPPNDSNQNYALEDDNELQKREADKINIQTVNNDKIKLRWTSIIKEKLKQRNKFIECGIISEDEPYVIAISSHLLYNQGDCDLLGGTGCSRALEIAYGLGGHKTVINITANHTISTTSYIESKSKFIKPGTSVEVDNELFLNNEYKGISAILAARIPRIDKTITDINGNRMSSDQEELIYLVPNLNAVTPLPKGLLPVDREEWIEEDNNGERIYRCCNY